MRGAYGPKSSTAYVELDAFEEDRISRAAMVEGSRRMLKALQSGKGPHAFLWRMPSTGGTWQPTDATFNRRYRVDLIREREARADRLRVSRDPCPVCATRADIGCEHRRVG